MSDVPAYTPDASQTEEERLSGLIVYLSAYIEQFHGGWVRLIDYDGKNVRVEMGGACIGCTLAPATLHGWVEGTIKQFFPNVRSVTAVTEPQPGGKNALEISGR